MSEWRERAEELGARQIERRKFLKGAAALSTLAMLESNKIAKAIVPGFGPWGPAEAQKIESIVVTMMENRSLDHYLGWMGSAIDGVQNQTFPKLLVDGDGRSASIACASQSSVSPTVFSGEGGSASTYHLPGHCLGSDPDHGWDASRMEFNGGAMNGFYHANRVKPGGSDATGMDSLGYYNKEDIPVLAWMAENYTTFSRYFSSVMGPTYPNRVYWLSGQGGGFKGNTIPGPKINGSIPPAGFTDGDPEPDGHDWVTIFHQLDAAGIPWAYYHTDLATVMLFFNRVEQNPGKVRFIADYYVDAALGLLPPVVFLDPGFTGIGNDDHPARDIKFGQRYIYDAFMALAEGPQWWKPSGLLNDSSKGSVFLVTYDEAGGFFDHVPPPRVTDPNASSDHCEDWSRLGFRVPTVVASPFSRGPDNGGPTGRVNQNLFDHTSIIKFIQWRFGLPSLNGFSWNALPVFTNGVPYGSRDNAPEIHNINEVLDFNSPHPEFPSEPPTIGLHVLQGLGCAQSDNASGSGPTEGLPDPDVPPLALPSALPGGPDARLPVVAHQDWIDLADRGFFGKYDYRARSKKGVYRD